MVALWGAICIGVTPANGESADAAEENPYPQEEIEMRPGEHFTFQIRWGIMTVGEATLGIEGPVDWNGQKAYHIHHTARTRGMVDAFYRVRNQVDSYLDVSGTRSLHYTKEQREGRSERDVVVYFDWEKETATYTDGDHREDPIDIEPHTHDPISIVFAARHLPFAEGETYTIPVSDGRRFFEAELTVTERKNLRTRLGTFDAILIQADTKELGGVFERGRDTDIQFWVSNDERRLPLLMLSSVSIGSFRAELIQVELPE